MKKLFTLLSLCMVFGVSEANDYLQLNLSRNSTMTIFNNPNALSKSLLKIRGGSKVRKLHHNGHGWYMVEYTQTEGTKTRGWMYDGSQNYLSTASGSTAEELTQIQNQAQEMEVSGTRFCLYLRSSATSKSNSKGCYTNTTPVISIGEEKNGFVPVRLYNGETGWMGSKYVKDRKTTSGRTEALSACIDCDKRTIYRDTPGTTRGVTVGSGAFRKYHQNPKVARMIQNCKKRYGGKRGRGWCLRGVRISGQTGGLLKKGVGLSPWASKAGRELKKQGFINLLDDPSYEITSPNDPDIPMGAILTYWGTNAPKGRTTGLKYGIGHAEIKTGPNQYCSDYVSSVPGGAAKIRGDKMEGGTGRRRRRLQGVWVKPGL